MFATTHAYSRAGLTFKYFMTNVRWLQMQTSDSKTSQRLESPEFLELFAKVSEEYTDRFKHRLLLVDIKGKVLHGNHYKIGGATEKERCRWRALAVSESLRWGQPSMVACPDDCMIWGIPITENNRILGGIVVKPCPFYADDDDGRSMSEKLSQACEDLQEIAEKYNLTNSSLLKLNRISAFVEREKAEAIHESKSKTYSDLHEIYLLEEPSLLSAILNEERNHARFIINRMLLHIYNRAPRNLNLLKGFSVELVIMMSRTAIDAGADPERIMGMSSGYFSTLTRIDDEEDLSQWMKNTLERIMDEIHAQRSQKHQARLSQAVKYIENHLAENFSRNDVAKYCGLSPGHFSHLISEETGKTFSEWVSLYRIRRACHLLSRSNESLAEIASECGFSDQSYFTKIFRRLVGQNPLQYRKFLAMPSASRGEKKPQAI